MYAIRYFYTFILKQFFQLMAGMLSLRYRQPNGFLGLSSTPRDAYALYITELNLGAGRGDARGITRGIFGPGELAANVDYLAYTRKSSYIPF